MFIYLILIFSPPDETLIICLIELFSSLNLGIKVLWIPVAQEVKYDDSSYKMTLFFLVINKNKINRNIKKYFTFLYLIYLLIFIFFQLVSNNTNYKLMCFDG